MSAQNKIANNNIDYLYNIWLGLGATKITLVEDSDDDTQAIRELLDEPVNGEGGESC